MATSPRYVGTTAAATKEYVRATLGDDAAFLQVFDLDGDAQVADGSQDEAAFLRAVCSAETEVDEFLASSHGAPFTGTIPDSVREISALRSLWCAVRTRLTMGDPEKAPFRQLYKDTDARLARLASDNRARIPEQGPPEPTRSLGGQFTAAAATPWQNAANGSSWSGF